MLDAGTQGGWQQHGAGGAFIRSLEIFRFLTAEDVARLAGAAGWHEYEPKQAIFGLQAGEYTYFVVKGHVRGFRLSAEGQELTVCDLLPGALVGPLLALSGELSATMLESGATGAIVCRVPYDFLRNLQGMYPHIADYMARLLWGRVEEAYEQMESLAYDPVMTGVKRVLLRKAQWNVDHEIQITREELATQVGSRREEVSRAVSKLVQNKMVECPARGQIIVPDPSRLEVEELSMR